MKTRSNMPLFVLEVSDVKALSNSQIDLLRCGDWLVKKDASGEHPYQVTFKKEGVGMCLTYHDASVIETQSYDWNNSLKKWVYNSEDKTELPVNEGDLVVDDLEVKGDADFKDDIKLDGESALAQYQGYLQASFYGSADVDAVFCKAVRNFNELQFICNFRLTNRTESGITLANDSLMVVFDIPEELQNKIYAHNGQPCSTNSESSQLAVAMAVMTISNPTGTVDSNGPRYADLFHHTGQLRFYYEGGNFTIPAGESKDFEARISLAL